MTSRERRLQTLLDCLFAAYQSAVPDEAAEARRVVTRAFARLSQAVGPQASPFAVKPPPAAHFPDAITMANRGPRTVADVAGALEALADDLPWIPGALAPAGSPLFEHYAQAYLVGPGGLEEREDAMIGMSLMAPGAVYPEHRHPPDEVYLVLTPGRWRQAGGDWQARDSGGFVYNPSNTPHAMAAMEEPGLSIWLLLGRAS